ncbi:MAG: DUF1080 domain-containing protein [Eudoraea sp.]|nr:DUF1080 domain-containing protein [Eudoraea sp.]
MPYKKILLVILILFTACKEKKQPPAEAEVADTSSWISLMDTEVWRGYNQEQLPDNWAIKEGVIECFGKAGDMGGDIITREQFDNFELQLEWKISEAGNSGIFYHVVESPVYHSPYQTGPEYQILDDVGFPDPLEDWQKTGANYAMHNARADKKLNPVGEWNSSSIIFKEGKVEHWLNGDKILEFDKFSEDWQTRRDSGKWEEYPDYGKANYGYIGLQDHGAGVWFRNIRVRRL